MHRYFRVILLDKNLGRVEDTEEEVFDETKTRERGSGRAPGGLPGLQTRGTGHKLVGGFDSHALPPSAFARRRRAKGGCPPARTTEGAKAVPSRSAAPRRAATDNVKDTLTDSSTKEGNMAGTAAPAEPGKGDTGKFKAGLEYVVAGTSSICLVDGIEGRLLYRGYDIQDLADNASFAETAFLLWYEHLPTRKEYESYLKICKESTELPYQVNM